MTIKVTKEDIGRGVIYTPGNPAQQKEEGVITSFNDSNVFVRYAKQHPTQNGQATRREDLEYSS